MRGAGAAPLRNEQEEGGVQIIDIIRSFLIACSFLTVLPVPRLDWTERSTRFFNLVLPLVGFVLAAVWLSAFLLLSRWDLSPLLRGVLMGLVVLAVTGGSTGTGLWIPATPSSPAGTGRRA